MGTTENVDMERPCRFCVLAPFEPVRSGGSFLICMELF
jgi:hypothetical protein